MAKEISIPAEVHALCDLLDITVAELIEYLFRDLCSLPFGSGSDARRAAKTWLLSTALSHSTEFSDEHTPAILQDFETLYIRAYAAVENPGWVDQRRILLQEIHRTWLERKQAKPVVS